ncbi:Fur family transcriptional regulator [Salidesulfovibrio brasiliensis]|uniref:Fur family transcriptional regulator n=1 Tax=Salidesulfovibrio brasiliensis TaxID=221711 RepID=UPI0006D03B63|nr:Fur family transcriptional regulator [Salidesulfovibrio brasiliensis]
MKTPQDAFTTYLSEKNLKMTPQRRLILDTFIDEKQHLSPEELYDKVKKVDPSIGQATVYRTLKLLVEAGIVESLDFADGVSRYEVSWGEEHHDHLICERCGKNIEILDDVIEKRQEAIAKEHGFTLSHHKMYLYGLCSKCGRKRS